MRFASTRPGDERRYIHWKSTAKTGRYMVRQFEETRRSHLVVALSLAATDYATDEEFELARQRRGQSRGARDPRRPNGLGGREFGDARIRQAEELRGAGAGNPPPVDDCSTTSR